jgi:hypothetical protein
MDEYTGERKCRKCKQWFMPEKNKSLSYCKECLEEILAKEGDI